MTNTITHWINNKPYPGASGTTAPVTNPATGAVTGEVALARGGCPGGDRCGGGGVSGVAGYLAGQSGSILPACELLNARKPELAKIITAEHGKVVSDALGEVSRGQEVVEFAAGAPPAQGGFTERLHQGRRVFHSPAVGPVGIISPFNFRRWCRCGFSDRHRGGQHRGAQTLREGSVRVVVAGRVVGRGGCRRGVQCAPAIRPPSMSCRPTRSRR